MDVPGGSYFLCIHKRILKIEVDKQTAGAIYGKSLQGLLFETPSQLLVFSGATSKAPCQVHKLQLSADGCSLVSSRDLNARIKHIKDVQLHQSTLAILESGLQQIFLCDLENPTKIQSIVEAEKPLDFIRFNPASGLLLCCGSRYLVQYSLTAGSFVEWPQRVKAQISEALEKEIPATAPLDIAFDPSNGHKLILYGRDFMLSLDLSICDLAEAQPKKRTSSRKKVVGETPVEPEKSTEEAAVVRVTKTYDSILFFGFLAAGEAVLVERPWLAIAADFPPVFKRKLFGGRQ